jgi:hypothetical protein
LYEEALVQKRVVKHTIQEFVDHDKVVLDGFLVLLAKVALGQVNDAIEKLEDDGGVDIGLGDRSGKDVLVPDVAEGSGAKGDDG